MSFNEVCEALAAEGLPSSRKHVNNLVTAGTLVPTRHSYHHVTFNRAAVRRFIRDQVKARIVRQGGAK